MLAFATLRGASWLILSRLIGRFIDFLNLLVLARLLSPSDFGVTALALAPVVIIDTVLEVPVTQALVRLKSIDKQHLDTGFTLAVLRSAAIGLLTLLCAFPYAWMNHDPSLIAVICVLAVGPVAKGFYSPAMVHFARDLNFRPTFIAETASKLSGLVGAMVVVLNGGGYWALVANYVIAALATSFLSYAFARYRPAFSFQRLDDFAGFMGWFTSSQIVSAINWQYDRIMIGAFVPDKAILGRYTVSNDVAIIPAQSFIGPALQPLMAAFSKVSSDPVRVRSAFLKTIRLVMLISVPACLGIALTSDLVTRLLLGEKWIDAAPYLTLMSISVLAMPFAQTINSVSLSLDRPQVMFRINLIDCIIRTSLITLAFYFYSVDGAIYARLVIAAIMFAVYLSQVRDLVGLGVKQQLLNLWKVAFAGAVMTIAVLWLRSKLDGTDVHHVVQLALISTFGAAAYGLALLALGVRLRLGLGRFELFDAGR